MFHEEILQPWLGGRPAVVSNHLQREMAAGRIAAVFCTVTIALKETGGSRLRLEEERHAFPQEASHLSMHCLAWVLLLESLQRTK